MIHQAKRIYFLGGWLNPSPHNGPFKTHCNNQDVFGEGDQRGGVDKEAPGRKEELHRKRWSVVTMMSRTFLLAHKPTHQLHSAFARRLFIALFICLLVVLSKLFQLAHRMVDHSEHRWMRTPDHPHCIEPPYVFFLLLSQQSRSWVDNGLQESTPPFPNSCLFALRSQTRHLFRESGRKKIHFTFDDGMELVEE
jgi:hypothetical protein